jgi:hypothetical protein
VTRRVAAVALLAGMLVGVGGPAASARSLVPKLPDPTDCHSMQEFLHVDNVRSCDGPPRG